MQLTNQVDPLRTPLESWTDETAALLSKHAESERLEFKGADQDWLSDDGRSKLAQNVAAMASLHGGFLVAGADDGEQLTAFAGRPVTEQERESLYRSMLDRVSPRPRVIGPEQFLDDDGKAILVFQVLPNPDGFPSSAGGRFYTRSGKNTVRMSPFEISLRMQAAGRDSKTAVSRASNHAADVVTQINGPALSVVLVPTSEIDLGMSGRSLSDRFRTAVHRESLAADEHLGGRAAPIRAGLLPTPFSGGLGIRGQDNIGLVVTHSGSVSLWCSSRLASSVAVTRPHLDAMFDVACRLTGLAFCVAQEIGVAGTVGLAFKANNFHELNRPVGEATQILVLDQHQDAELSLVVSSTEAGIVIYEAVHLVLERLTDNGGDALNLVPYEKHRDYFRGLMG